MRWRAPGYDVEREHMLYSTIRPDGMRARRGHNEHVTSKQPDSWRFAANKMDRFLLFLEKRRRFKRVVFGYSFPFASDCVQARRKTPVVGSFLLLSVSIYLDPVHFILFK